MQVYIFQKFRIYKKGSIAFFKVSTFYNNTKMLQKKTFLSNTFLNYLFYNLKIFQERFCEFKQTYCLKLKTLTKIIN